MEISASLLLQYLRLLVPYEGLRVPDSRAEFNQVSSTGKYVILVYLYCNSSFDSSQKAVPLNSRMYTYPGWSLHDIPSIMPR